MPNALARLRAALLCAALILVVLPAAASARWSGGPATAGQIQGTAAADTIKGLGGADVINGRAEADRDLRRAGSGPHHGRRQRTASTAVPAATASPSTAGRPAPSKAQAGAAR